MSFEIQSATKSGNLINGTVHAARTNKVYAYSLNVESGDVLLANGTRSVPSNQMRDVRNHVREQAPAALPADPAPAARACIAEMSAPVLSPRDQYKEAQRAQRIAFANRRVGSSPKDGDPVCRLYVYGRDDGAEQGRTIQDILMADMTAEQFQRHFMGPGMLERMYSRGEYMFHVGRYANGVPVFPRTVVTISNFGKPEMSAPVLPADAPVLYFEQDGAHFCYRDRPFYFVAFDYVGPDGYSNGVCPSFHCSAPFSFPDFDMAGAERAALWFAQEAATAGFRAERAPDYYRTTEGVQGHPDAELADLKFVQAERDLNEESAGCMTVAEFKAFRAIPQEPVKREMFDTFEAWRPAYLKLLHDWFAASDLAQRDLNEEEHYTAGLTPLAAANLECAALCS